MTVFTEIETLLYAVSRLFLAPVMLLIALALAYALVVLGAFAVEAWQRRQGTHGHALFVHARKGNGTWLASDDLELWIMQRLEWLRIVSRTAPMLGLIATMIPMGPALLALGNNDAGAVGRNMVAAFSAVILALLAASICFFILTVKRRWLLEDLRQIERQRQDGGRL
ncbi:MotA/TolQ/ExbB proton channel family protein [Halopseudomonas phragmitis]|uniref:Biopolymer transporter ExbD n=2 Tax=Pseudomonadaceae TaxID=135621 RepID=A0A1V0B2I1_9GAMM|nr:MULTISPECIES: MotA/TolQ/ExbB proton channel family protein [Pseudomonadaceae]AQZ94139.1 biopolymer transporter ExbD [Halopseudomonas phragmitis]RHW20751.1 biopolymer transporter ExbD [Pseudomonas jilinensis]